jgi:type I restriction enzyme S subunit
MVSCWLATECCAEEGRLVAYIDRRQTKADRVKSFQVQTAAELDALLPSIRDKAFKGGL